jgi:probable HAF family extracellular repeat protein
MTYNKLLQPIALSATIVCSATTAFGASFMPLPQLPGSTQAGAPFGVSHDGNVIVGTSHDGTAFQAVRWTTPMQIVTLGANANSFARGVSANGSIITGWQPVPGGQEAFRWTEGIGLQGLGDLPGGELLSNANDISGDGSVVVGVSSSASGFEAFRWSAATGMIGLGTRMLGDFGSYAHAVSADGSVVVGQDRVGPTSDGTFEAFRWTPTTGMSGLGDLPGGDFHSVANDVSADGSVVVGESNAGGSRAFRWTATTGMVPLPDVPGLGPTVRAAAVSGDGNVIVGSAGDSLTTGVFVWDALHGSRNLAALLTGQGADAHGWILGGASATSYDGLVIVGVGIDESGMPQSWRAQLDEGTFIPEPSSSALCAAACAALLCLWATYRSA